MKYRLAVFLGGEIKNDYRVLKTLHTLSQTAYIDVFYISGNKREKPEIINCNFFPIEPRKNFYTKLIQNSFFGFEFSFFFQEALAQKKKYDFVWANDLPTLLPAIRLAKKTRAKLIYDSHEIYLETLNQFFPWNKKSWKQLLYHFAYKLMYLHGSMLEKRGMKRVDHFVTVNESLLEYFTKKYDIKHSSILMNFPQNQAIVNDPFDFRMAYNWDSDKLVLLYQGGLNDGRGLTLLVRAMQQLKDEFRLVIIGEGMLKPNLQQLTAAYGLNEVIKFIDFLPLEILPMYTTGADLGVNLLEPLNLSKLYASPNKLYEYIHASLPVLATNTPENKKVFDRFDIGFVCENNLESVVSTLKQINRDKLEALKSNLPQIKEYFTWQSQENLLHSILHAFDANSVAFQECSTCLLNTENCPSITFDQSGKCDTCRENQELLKEYVPLTMEELNNQLQKIKSRNKSKYDCLIGISGGTDSSYLVYLAKKWGLNPLLLHVDGGWNNDLTVKNIQQIIKNSGFDYHTVVIPWDELRDFQRAFIYSQVMDIDLPFDNLMVYYNYKVAKQFGIRCVFNGYNTATEGFLPHTFTHFKYDKKNILNIHKQFGEIEKTTLKFLGPFEYFYFEHIKKIHFEYPLNYIKYNQQEAKNKLQEEYQWVDYDKKHHDNFYTKFYQELILPQKFGINKNLAHQSMLILSKQITKKAAKEIGASQEPIDQTDILYFIKKLNLSEKFFDEYLHTKGIDHRFYGSSLDLYDKFAPLYRLIKRTSGFKWFKS